MTFYTYPRAIDESERRLLDAVNAYFDQSERNNMATIMFAMHVDTNVGGKNPRMRAGFVWEMMASGFVDEDSNDARLTKTVAYWWRQRWNLRIHAPEFSGMYEHTRRGLIVQLAQLCESQRESSPEIVMLTDTIRTLTKSAKLSWEYLVNLAEIIPTYSVLAHTYAPLDAPFPISVSTWNFVWAVLASIHPGQLDAIGNMAKLVDSASEFGRSLDDFLGAATAQTERELPESLVS